MWGHGLWTTHALLGRHHSCHRLLLHWHTLHHHARFYLDDTTLLHHHSWSHALLLHLLHPELLLLLLLLEGHSLLKHLWHGLAWLLTLITPHDCWSDLRSSRIDRPLDMHHARLDHASLVHAWLLGRSTWLHSRADGPDHARRARARLRASNG